ncbi:energy transducer TonB [Gluconobacter sp.]|uniref:energy transducer TonB n=1 Tax=Gluconobacter sp. TaxID=1876758 RepID=UPI0039E79445
MKHFLLLLAVLAVPSVACGQEMKFSTPRAMKNGPVYPEKLIAKNATGQVNLMFDIDKTGHTVNCQVISSTNPEFNESALDHCRQSRYTPATVHGHPAVEHHHHTTLSFDLDN